MKSDLPKNPDELTMGKRQKVTSGRDGGVRKEEGTEKQDGPNLAQGETLSGKSKGGETERATKNRKAININGGQLVDPAYREIGDGGDAANAGNLGNEKVEDGGRKNGSEMKKEGVMGDEEEGDLGGVRGAGKMNLPKGEDKVRESKL